MDGSVFHPISIKDDLGCGLECELEILFDLVGGDVTSQEQKVLVLV